MGLVLKVKLFSGIPLLGKLLLREITACSLRMKNTALKVTLLMSPGAQQARQGGPCNLRNGLSTVYPPGSESRAAGL